MATIPSLALIPSAYKASKVYSVLPSNGDGDFSFARNSSGTRVNSNGLIETVGNNIPRLDYSDGGCPSLLLEPQRTNLVTYSEDFSQSSWIKLGAGTGSAAVVTSNYSISPDGTQNATRLQCDLNGGTTSSDQSLVYFIPSGSSNTYTNSFYVKGVSGQAFAIGRDLNNKKIFLTDGTWQKVDFSYTNTPIIFIGSRGTFGSDDVLDIQIYGAQLEQGYATSYIPNFGTALGVTRVAETCNGAGNSNTFNDSEGVLFAEISALANGGSTRVISLSGGSQSVNNIYINFNPGGGLSAQVLTSGGSNNLSTLNINQTDLNKIAVKYKANDFSLWLNGIEVDTDTTLSSTPTGLDRLNFDFGAGSLDFYGKTKQLQYFDSALNDTDLETLTSWTSFNEMATSQLYTIQ